ncbi:MAG: hypothetical protein NTV49_14535 [Kiritimatiellaeota bacterium]|nr:hypothetical protein [Kiritimatiellota bacterium]
MRWSGLFLAGAIWWAAAGGACHAEDQPADESGLGLVWACHTNAPDRHAAVAEACQAFRTKTPRDPLVVVAQGLEAWHLLQAGKTNAALRLWETMLAPANGALSKAGAQMAHNWLTRLDRESVKAALMRVYVRDVEFPGSLEAIKTLKKGTLPPLADRWGNAWTYRLADLRAIQGLRGQRYVLESRQMGAASDLTRALAWPYAGGIDFEPMRILPGVGAGDTVEFSSPTHKRIVLMPGTDMDGVVFAYLGRSLLILTDGNHWRVTPRPR